MNDNPDTWPARLIDSGPSAGSYAISPPLTFGQVVRRERERRLLSPACLAARLELPALDPGTTLSLEGKTLWVESVESGDGLEVTLRSVRRLSLAFGLTPQQLLADVGVWGDEVAAPAPDGE